MIEEMCAFLDYEVKDTDAPTSLSTDEINAAEEWAERMLNDEQTHEHRLDEIEKLVSFNCFEPVLHSQEAEGIAASLG